MESIVFSWCLVYIVSIVLFFCRCKFIKLILRYSFEVERQASSGVRKSDPKESSSSRQASTSGNKLERRASFRQKFGALFKGSGDFSTAINRSLQPIRRSLSFKDLNRGETKKKQPYRTNSMQWYNSLSSLAEDEHVDEAEIAYKKTTNEEDIVNGKVQVTRTRSFIEKTPVCISRCLQKKETNKKQLWKGNINNFLLFVKFDINYIVTSPRVSFSPYTQVFHTASEEFI